MTAAVFPWVGEPLPPQLLTGPRPVRKQLPKQSDGKAGVEVLVAGKKYDNFKMPRRRNPPREHRLPSCRRVDVGPFLLPSLWNSGHVLHHLSLAENVLNTGATGRSSTDSHRFWWRAPPFFFVLNVLSSLPQFWGRQGGSYGSLRSRKRRSASRYLSLRCGGSSHLCRCLLWGPLSSRVKLLALQKKKYSTAKMAAEPRGVWPDCNICSAS